MLELVTMDEIIEFVESLDGVLTLRPCRGDGSPEISWGDTFFYYSPDGVTPSARQPFATIVTKNYPGEDATIPEGGFRVNVAGNATGESIVPHPTYPGWLSVIDPGPNTEVALRDLLRAAHERTRSRHLARSEGQTSPQPTVRPT